MKTARVDALRIFLIDDHPVVREGLASMIAGQPDFAVVGQAASAADALGSIGAARPDVVLVDLNLPDKSGSDLIAALCAALPEAKLVVVSGYDDDYHVAEALRAGAHGYLLKTSTVEEIARGVRAVADGGTALTPGLTSGLLRAARAKGKSNVGTIDTLTPRELQVMQLIATGLSTREVASNLSISPKTVETHRCRLYEKLGCSSPIDLTRIALRTGIVAA